LSIEARNITKTFGSFTALKDVTLTVPSGQLVALLGPSGSGKTSLLRIIAGLEVADSGSVILAGEDATGHDVRERQVGFVFQHYALFRHMSVFENVAFGLRVRPRSMRPRSGPSSKSEEGLPDERKTRPSEVNINARVNELLRLVQLDFLADRLPSQLSGGQRQRVALARALAVEPKVLLLDEPFGALDAKVRQELRGWLRRLHDTVHLTSVFVTHDQEEALELADRVVVMNHGVIEQEGTPDELFEHPKTPFVMNFLGNVNIFHGRVEDGRAILGPIDMDYPEHPSKLPREAAGYARPHELEIGHEEGNGNGLWAALKTINTAGPVVKLQMEEAGGQRLHVELSRDQYDKLGLAHGQSYYVRPRRVRIFVSEKEERPLRGR
jgi:sulfate transport system ATP-binding protein